MDYHPLENSIKVPAGWFCSRQHAAEFAIARSRKEKQRKEKAEHRKARMDVKPIGYWMRRAQAAFNAYIRERDRCLPCICCGAWHEGQWHAGHYRPTGSHPGLRFDEDNCHKQASYCNSHKSGNLIFYRKGLIEKIGLEKVELLEGPHEPKRYRKEDYQAIEAEYKAKLKQLS